MNFIYRENYVFLQVGFQHLAYEKREDVPSYEAESLFGKWDLFLDTFHINLSCTQLISLFSSDDYDQSYKCTSIIRHRLLI